MSPLTIVALAAALAVGFFLGRQTGKKDASFSDPDVAQEASGKGHTVVAARIAKRKERIMEKVKEAGKVTNDDVEDLFCIGDATARNYLNELEGEGKLRQVGEDGRGVYYTPIQGF